MDKKVCYVEMDALHLKQKSFLFDEMIWRLQEDSFNEHTVCVKTQWYRGYCVWNHIYNCLTIWGEEGYMYTVCRRMIGHCVCGQTACEWKRINCSYIHMYILIFIYYSLVLYTFKEFLCTVTRVREPPFSYHCH